MSEEETTIDGVPMDEEEMNNAYAKSEAMEMVEDFFEDKPDAIGVILSVKPNKNEDEADWKFDCYTYFGGNSGRDQVEILVREFANFFMTRVITLIKSSDLCEYGTAMFMMDTFMSGLKKAILQFQEEHKDEDN